MAKNTLVKRGPAAEGFWERPALMNLAADLLLVFGIVVLAWVAINGLRRLPIYPVRELIVASDVARVSRAQIEHVARTALGGNLLGVNLDEARGAFEKLPWVRRAELRRQWPDALELVIEEQVAVARWSRGDGEPRLVNSHGEVFMGSGGEDLPAFAGPEGSAAVMLDRFHEFEPRLAQIRRKPVTVSLTAREAWQIRLDDGVLLELGRDQARLPLGERLDRFVAHYMAARAKVNAPVAAADMRYPNGFVLRLGAPTVADSKLKQS